MCLTSQFMRIYPVFMQLLGYGQGITMIIPSGISPDMFGTIKIMYCLLLICAGLPYKINVGCFTVL